jgi:antitoxin VapB
MALNIKDDSVHEAVKRITLITGESRAQAMATAVRERLARLEKDELAARLLAIGHKSASRQQNHRPSSAAMDGVMNDRTISVSNSRPSAIVVPIWPSTRRSLKMNDAMVKANSRPAAVTTDPLPAIDRMMPVLMPAWISSLKPGDQQQVVVRPHGQQQDDGQRQYHPIQLDAHDVLPDQHRHAERGAQRERYCAHDDERGDEAAGASHTRFALPGGNGGGAACAGGTASTAQPMTTHTAANGLRITSPQ